MGAGDVSFWSGGQDVTAGPNNLAPRKSDRRPEIPRGYASDENPEVQSYLQRYLYNKGNGWRLSKLCDPCSGANAPAGSCTRGDSDHKCAQCRDKGKGKGKGQTCGWKTYKAAKTSLKKKAGQEESEEEESYAKRQLPVGTRSEADTSYWSTAPSESGASFSYGGTGYDRASYSTASSILDDYTTGSQTPVPFSSATAPHQTPFAQPPSQGGPHRDALPHRHVDSEWQYDESSGTFTQTRMIPKKREPEVSVSAEEVQQYIDQHRQPHEDQRLTRICDPCHFGGLPGCRFSRSSYPLGWCTTCQSTPGSACTVDMYGRAQEKLKREKDVEAWMEKHNRKKRGL
ncbi:hypothetical protein PG991_003176 [Apiospora marii]|uniref:Zn(2)-C6 fungal-type domain-containing protein n=1 Tax=Apiospora marii TaxID=335849 RepID=A0ABR1SHH0_9PEZI